MEIGWALGILFVFVTIIFIAIAFFLPEWVGITGKKAQEIMEEQRGPSTNESELTSKKDESD